MLRVWTSNEKGSDKLIAFANNTIYKANPKSAEATEELAKEMKSGKLDNLALWWIQTFKCTEIRLQDGKTYIELLQGKETVEELRIKDEYTRYQVYDYFKTNIFNSESSIDKWTAMRAGKKPMIAFFVALGLFLWTLFYAIEAQSGKVYYMKDSYFNLTGIVLGIASLGLVNVIFLFSSLLCIALFAFIRKAKNPPTMNRIIIKK